MWMLVIHDSRGRFVECTKVVSVVRGDDFLEVHPDGEIPPHYRKQIPLKKNWEYVLRSPIGEGISLC